MGAEEVRKIATAHMNQVEVSDWTQTSPLKDLGLLKTGTLDKIEAELKDSQRLSTKRSEEYRIRFGLEPPSLDDDPYMLEYRDQMSFLQNKIREREGQKQLKEAAAEMNQTSGDGEEAEEMPATAAEDA